MNEITQTIKTVGNSVILNLPDDYVDTEIEVRVRKKETKSNLKNARYEILKKLSKESKSFDKIDPVEWQRETRKDNDIFNDLIWF